MSSFGPQEEAAVDLLANEPERAACLEAEPVEEARQEFLEGEAARSRIEWRQRQQVGMQLAELRAVERGLGLRGRSRRSPQRGGQRGRWKLSVIRPPDLTPDQRRSWTPANTDEALEPSEECSSRVASTLEADGGQSSPLIYTSVRRTET
jgi:hypothetical protein